jgi:predicted DCC family thiol-disulfide oxidoreductase YuxK
MTNDTGRYLLFFDGSCGLCRHLAAFARWAARGLVQPVDAADPRQMARYPGLSPQQAMGSVHLLTPGRRLHRGYDAVVVLVSLLPGMGWLSTLMGTRLARRVGWAVYEWVTAHRHAISHLLLLE